MKNSKLVHLLPATSRNHILQRGKLLVHLGPSPPLNQAMSGLARNFASRRGRSARLFSFGLLLSG